MKKIIFICFLSVFFAMTGVALAGQESGFYLGASLGATAIDVSKDSIDFDDDDLGYKIFAGYNLGVIPLIDIGVEGSYVDFGEASDAEILGKDVGVTAWDLFAVAGLNLGPIGLFGKVGQAWWDSDSDVFDGILDESGADMVYGAGIKFQLGSLGVRAEYEHFDLDLADIGYASVGAFWTF